jgi:hypothetical protein
MDKISANGPHKLLRAGLLSVLSSEVKDYIDRPSIPLFKLKWNIDTRAAQNDSIIRYLFSTLH